MKCRIQNAAWLLKVPKGRRTNVINARAQNNLLSCLNVCAVPVVLAPCDTSHVCAKVSGNKLARVPPDTHRSSSSEIKPSGNTSHALL